METLGKIECASDRAGSSLSLPFSLLRPAPQRSQQGRIHFLGLRSGPLVLVVFFKVALLSCSRIDSYITPSVFQVKSLQATVLDWAMTMKMHRERFHIQPRDSKRLLCNSQRVLLRNSHCLVSTDIRYDVCLPLFGLFSTVPLRSHVFRHRRYWCNGPWRVGHLRTMIRASGQHENSPRVMIIAIG